MLPFMGPPMFAVPIVTMPTPILAIPVPVPVPRNTSGQTNNSNTSRDSDGQDNPLEHREQAYPPRGPRLFSSDSQPPSGSSWYDHHDRARSRAQQQHQSNPSRFEKYEVQHPDGTVETGQHEPIIEELSNPRVPEPGPDRSPSSHVASRETHETATVSSQAVPAAACPVSSAESTTDDGKTVQAGHTHPSTSHGRTPPLRIEWKPDQSTNNHSQLRKSPGLATSPEEQRSRHSAHHAREPIRTECTTSRPLPSTRKHEQDGVSSSPKIAANTLETRPWRQRESEDKQVDDMLVCDPGPNSPTTVSSSRTASPCPDPETVLQETIYIGPQHRRSVSSHVLAATSNQDATRRYRPSHLAQPHSSQTSDRSRQHPQTAPLITRPDSSALQEAPSDRPPPSRLELVQSRHDQPMDPAHLDDLGVSPVDPSPLLIEAPPPPLPRASLDRHSSQPCSPTPDQVVDRLLQVTGLSATQFMVKLERGEFGMGETSKGEK